MAPVDEASSASPHSADPASVALAIHAQLAGERAADGPPQAPAAPLDDFTKLVRPIPAGVTLLLPTASSSLVEAPCTVCNMQCGSQEASCECCTMWVQVQRYSKQRSAATQSVGGYLMSPCEVSCRIPRDLKQLQVLLHQSPPRMAAHPHIRGHGTPPPLAAVRPIFSALQHMHTLFDKVKPVLLF